MDAVSTIGRGTHVRGSVRGEGDLEIQGRVEGSVAVTGELSIAEGALIRSDVSGRRVIIQGAVAGNVSATESIVLEAGARVVGDLGAPQIGIRPGALVRGNVSTGAPLAAAAAPARARVPAAVTPARPAAPPPRAAAPTRAAPPPARPAVPARPAPAPRHATPTLTSARVESVVAPVVPAPSPSAASRAEDAEDAPGSHGEEDLPVTQDAEDVEQAGGPPPPVVPTIRKGAKAQLRRKGAR
jgi:cytoskeletal protein CcmA (bactofilin family)